MDEKFKTSLFPLIILFLISLPNHLCQDLQYKTCRQPFQCGNIANISYPFWGSSRHTYYGYSGFGLDCRAEIPQLNISSTLYQVLEINNTAQNLQVARHDLWNNTCPAFLQNTTLSSQIFDLPSDSNDQNITLYYGCTLGQVQPRNKFNCSVNGAGSLGFYVTAEVPLDPGSNYSCRNSTFVPVNQYTH